MVQTYSLDFEGLTIEPNAIPSDGQCADTGLERIRVDDTVLFFIFHCECIKVGMIGRPQLGIGHMQANVAFSFGRGYDMSLTIGELIA